MKAKFQTQIDSPMYNRVPSVRDNIHSKLLNEAIEKLSVEGKSLSIINETYSSVDLPVSGCCPMTEVTLSVQYEYVTTETKSTKKSNGKLG